MMDVAERAGMRVETHVLEAALGVPVVPMVASRNQGVSELMEAAMQLMGRCGNRQLGPATNTKSPEIILCSDNGGILQTHACIILGRG